MGSKFFGNKSEQSPKKEVKGKGGKGNSNVKGASGVKKTGSGRGK